MRSSIIPFASLTKSYTKKISDKSPLSRASAIFFLYFSTVEALNEVLLNLY